MFFSENVVDVLPSELFLKDETTPNVPHFTGLAVRRAILRSADFTILNVGRTAHSNGDR